MIAVEVIAGDIEPAARPVLEQHVEVAARADSKLRALPLGERVVSEPQRVVVKGQLLPDVSVQVEDAVARVAAGCMSLLSIVFRGSSNSRIHYGPKCGVDGLLALALAVVGVLT